MNRESKTLEYKEQITKTFLKTVSAYANYGTGEIIFGISDDHKVCGIASLEDACLTIENMIKDNLVPVPKYQLEVHKNNTITLTVSEGNYKPYLYKHKAYKRNDSATIEVDRLEFQRLILEGQNQTYEEQICDNQTLTFETFEHILKNHLNIQDLNNDILKTLELMSPDEHYNNAAALVSDHNHYKGIDIVRFGKSISEIMDRTIIENVSVFTQFHEAINMYQRYYQYEKIDDISRTKVEMIPEKAFREALANALVHRLWDIDASIKISMFEDHIELTSPGSLLSGISVDEYLHGQISMLRNPIIGNIFFRLNYIEKFGTGIRRINEAYEDSIEKPAFTVFENSILVSLPVIHHDLELDCDEQMIVDLLRHERRLTRLQIDLATGFQKAKTVRILNRLIDQSIVKKHGSGKNTTYALS